MAPRFFSPMDLCFIDSETRSLLDVTQVGAFKYAHHPSTEGIVWGALWGDEPNGVLWSPQWAWGNTVASHADAERPERLLEHAIEGGYFVAWNAFFDRWIWNAVMVPKYGWPRTDPEQWLCAQAQAEANNLPGRLEKACEALRTPYQKDPQGKKLIHQLSRGDRATWDSRIFETPAKMGHFRAYCLKDVYAMRDVWDVTRPLTMDEWHEYHVSERINDRGVMVDAEFAAAAMRYAGDEKDEINAQLAELTGDPGMTLNTHLRKARWLFDELWPDEELQDLVTRPEKVEGKWRGSCDRMTRESVLEMLIQPEHAELFHVEHYDKIVAFIEAVEAGNSAAVQKFTAITNQVTADSRVRGGYSFNGAGQTGRFSSRGIQVHNIIRDPVDKKNRDRAIDAIEMVLDGAEPDALRDEFNYPISRLLARLIRPTMIAGEGNTLVWADWDQIEGRALPWLAKNPLAELKLDQYRQGLDVYSITAAEIAGKPVDQVTDHERQALGKVPELALGFGGAVGALTAMSRSYGVSLSEDEKVETVFRWRNANPWAMAFWNELWEAALAAYNHPGSWWHAGRVRYLYHPQLMRGTLICELPDQRWIVYPQFKREYLTDEQLEEMTGKSWERRATHRWRTSYVKGYGSGSARVDLWYGVLAENITQGIAASCLRFALAQLDDITVLHTHDEIVTEVGALDVAEAKATLRHAMTDLPEWADGLPLSVSVEHGPYYSK